MWISFFFINFSPLKWYLSLSVQYPKFNKVWNKNILWMENEWQFIIFTCQFQSLTFGKRKTFSPWKQMQTWIRIVSILLRFHILKYVSLVENVNFPLFSGITSFRWKALTFCWRGEHIIFFIYAFWYIQKVIWLQHFKVQKRFTHLHSDIVSLFIQVD